MIFQVSKANRALRGIVKLDGSKSISNRALMIRALCDDSFAIQNLSSSDDSVAMKELIDSPSYTLDVGPAGTTFRFLTAYLAIQPGEKILTGSERMQKRPIGALVEALNALGANISYTAESGYPPLRIGEPGDLGATSHIRIPAHISSQFISALLMIAPSLPRGLHITLEGDLVSRSYLQMTLTMMSYFGIAYTFEGQEIFVGPQAYQARPYTVESDWSAASYHYANAALSDALDLRLQGLHQDSMQGDAITMDLFDRLGVTSTWENGDLRLTKGSPRVQVLDHDYLLCPDIAQTIAVVAAGLNIPALFTGLQTLSIKETDRIQALKDELAKVGVSFAKVPPRFASKSGQQQYLVEGQASWEAPPRFATYHDHRMAMAFAPLSMLGTIQMEDPRVVEKSYTGFWRDLTDLGWTVELID